MLERLQKILANYGVTSRRKAEELILAGRVAVNDRLITELGTKADGEDDRITVDGNLINPQKPHLDYLLLHKPRGYLCTRNDPRGRKTIQELLPSQYQHLYSVGRLDCDSSGALILTNDGDFAHRLMHPSHHVAKVYQVSVVGHLSDHTLHQWRSGIDLNGKITLPAEVTVLEIQATSTQLQIVLKEGRNRQIRRVAKILGHPVIDLHREAIASIHLQDLASQTYRHLTPSEKEELVMDVMQTTC
jgi:16S rRNA pseudouridine516 synthase